jgi:hypothetical protein
VARRHRCVPDSVLPITPISKSFSFKIAPTIRKNAQRRQLPIVAVYALTDYRSQGQTLVPVIIDIGKTLTGCLTAFNAYVALEADREFVCFEILTTGFSCSIRANISEMRMPGWNRWTGQLSSGGMRKAASVL